MDVILRHRVDRDFTVLTNKVLRDSRLSWGARGLLAYLLHLPGDFRLSVTYLTTQSPDGRDATRSRLKELQLMDYVTINREREMATGCYTQTVWTVTDTPIQPRTDYPTTDNPALDNPPLIRTTNQQEIKTTTTTGNDQAQQLVVVGNQFQELYFPPVFSGEFLGSALKILESCPVHCHQQVLYEVAAIIKRGSLRGSPIGLLHGLVKKAAQGTFVPSYGIGYAEKRRHEAESRTRAESERASRERLDSAKDREVGREALAKIRQQVCRN